MHVTRTLEELFGDLEINIFEVETEQVFLLLDEAVAFRAVFAIVSGSDGRTDWWKRFWSQLSN